MIASICHVESAKMILVCDGDIFSVIGDSETAKSIKSIVEDSESLFNLIKKTQNDSFDPVSYWYESSINFSESAPPVEYSEETLADFKNQLAKAK